MEVYGKECMSRTRVFEWPKRFHKGRTIGVARIFDWGIGAQTTNHTQ